MDSEWRESGDRIEYGEGRHRGGGLTPNEEKGKGKVMHYVGSHTGYLQKRSK